MKYQNKDYQSVWLENGRLYIIEQSLLPAEFKIIELKDIRSVYRAIKEMQVRGAPAIGAVAAIGLALAIKANPLNAKEYYDHLKSSRPTAVDLRNGLDFVLNSINYGDSAEDKGAKAMAAASRFTAGIIEECRLIGQFGNELIKENALILTHCNAGALATVDHGTALAPLRAAYNSGKNIFVYVDETRPRLQGARLTAWELAEEGIDHAVIVDSAAGYYMYRGEVDLVITGADRITQNGDAANKIGTYSKAVLAKENNIPFYIAAPFSTFDHELKRGSEIPIEERHQDEVLKIKDISLTNGTSSALNPAFDVTPHSLITGYITPAGIFKQKDMGKLWEIVIRERNSEQI